MNLEAAWESLRRVLRKDTDAGVEAADGVHLDVRMLPVLPADQLAALLREVLREKGWQDQPDGSMTLAVGDAVATLSPDATAVELVRRVATKVTVQTTVRVEKDTKDDDAARALEAQSARELATATTRERERLARENLARLMALEPDVRAGMQEALNRTYRRALERRAKELGELESLREAGDARGTYEVTVVVKA